MGRQSRLVLLLLIVSNLSNLNTLIPKIGLRFSKITPEIGLRDSKKTSLQPPNLMESILRHKRQFKKRSQNKSSLLPYTAALPSIIQILETEYQMVCVLCIFDINVGALESWTQ